MALETPLAFPIRAFMFLFSTTYLYCSVGFLNKLCGEAATICPRPLQVNLLALKMVSKSRVTWATSTPIILVFLGLPVLDLGPMCATDRQTSDAHHRLMPPTLGPEA